MQYPETPEELVQYVKDRPFHGKGRASIWFADRAKQRIVTTGLAKLGYKHQVFLDKDYYGELK